MRRADYESRLNARLFQDRDPWSGAVVVCHCCGGHEHEPGCVDEGTALVPKRAGALVGLGPVRRNLRHDPIAWSRHQAAGGEQDAPTRLRKLLGRDHFAPARKAPRPDQDRMVTIGKLAKALDRKPSTIREWIDDGIIPDAPQRGPGNIRWWRESQVRGMAKIAQHERLIGPRPWAVLSETLFRQRVWDKYGDQW